jgi:hypothetical protein
MRSRCLVVFTFLLICFLAGSVAQAAAHEEIYARIWVSSIEEKGRILGERGLDVDAAGPDWLDVVVDSERLRDLQAKGYNVEVVYWNPEQRDAALFGAKGLIDFHDYSATVTEMQQAATDHPSIVILDTLGYSVQGRMILGAKVSDNPGIDEDEPEFRIIGNHHGNEYMSVEMPLLMLQYLTDNYGSNSQVTHLVNDRETWIIPMLNPDGRTAGTRYNANGVDLNRDYGYIWNHGSPDIFSQPETRVIRQHGLEHNFALSLSFHTSGDVMNYVWNYKNFPVADSAFVVDISEEYGSYNGYWVVEGYNWYQTYGDCNDWSYGSRSDIDATIEVANNNITQVWDLNRSAILAMMERTDDGVWGLLTDASTGEPLQGMVRCTQFGQPVYTGSVVGDYQKNLLPGTYSLKFSANGYQDSVISGIVVSGTTPTIRNVGLKRGADLFAVHVVSCYFYDPYSWPNQYPNNPTNASAALGLPDDLFASLGRGGHLELDMGQTTPIVDGDGNDFTVHEDGSADGYNVYWSSVPYGGTWSLIGAGTGTTSFDISSLPVDSVRYIKILDDNDGSATEMYPGCDIDAVTHPRPITGAYLIASDYSVDDDNSGQSSGDGDGKVDFGETIEFTVVLENAGDSTAYNVQATLRTNHPEVSVIDSQQTFGNIPAGDTGINTSAFVFSVSANVGEGESIPLELEISADNGTWIDDGLSLVVHAPLLVYSSVQLNEVSGNGNGEADAGEVVDLTVTLKNEGGQDGQQVEADLWTDDAYVTVTSASSLYPDIPPQDSRSSLSAYRIDIDEECPLGHSASLILNIDASGPYSAVDTFILVIGKKPILFVDDDGGDSYESYFLYALDSVGVGYDVWTYADSACPPDTVLALYQAVVWSTGDDYGSLSNPKTLISIDKQRLTTYLDNGGSLFLSSQDLLLDNNPDAFITDYLHVAGHNDDEEVLSVAGVAGDTITNGMSFSLSYPFFNFSDHIFPGTGAAGIFSETSKGTTEPRTGVQLDEYPGKGTGPVNYCALRYPASGTSGYQVVFSAFSFEAVPQAGDSPNNSYTLMRRIMDWFGVGKTSQEFMRGDANADQTIDLGDALYILNYLFKSGPAPVPFEAGDANCDEVVDLGDALIILNYLFKNGPPPGC